MLMVRIRGVEFHFSPNDKRFVYVKAGHRFMKLDLSTGKALSVKGFGPSDISKVLKIISQYGIGFSSDFIPYRVMLDRETFESLARQADAQKMTLQEYCFSVLRRSGGKSV